MRSARLHAGVGQHPVCGVLYGRTLQRRRNSLDAQSCRRDPPCHPHGPPGQQTPAPPCSHHIVVQADVAPPLVTPDLTSNVLAMDVPALSVGAFPALSGVDLLASHALSPPGLTVLSSA